MTNYHQILKYLPLCALVVSLGTASSAFAESTGRYIDDATLTAKVKEAILADPQLKVLEVQVNTTHGVVLLTGAVDTEGQEHEAVKIANQIDGVVSVTDNLSIKVTDSD